MPRSINALRNEIKNLKEELGTWQKAGDHYGVSRSVAWRIVNDSYEPKNNIMRRKLGLTEIITQEIARDAKGRFISRG